MKRLSPLLLATVLSTLLVTPAYAVDELIELIELGDLPEGGSFSSALGVSADGSVVVGY